MKQLTQEITTWLLAGLPICDESTVQNRLSQCQTCDQVILNSDQEPHKCQKCGCYLQWKVLMDTTKCPLNKW